jgi:poly(3-hydroxybutyrate) depolymerase
MSFVHGSIVRKYFLKVPAGWTSSTNWPVLLLLPGHGQSITEFASAQQEILGLADADGWIIVFAEATAGVDSYKWFSSENPNLTQPYIDDAAFLFALVDELKASGLNVNSNRVYLGGFSNGGSMVHYAASRTNHPFAAFAIIESGTAPLAHYREPYDRLAPDSGTVVPANIPLPWSPRPVLLMNMATSVPWVFEGRGPIRGVRHNVARWTEANQFGGPVTNPALGIIEPPAAPWSTNFSWSATANDRCRVAYEDIRPDHHWPTNLVLNGWTLSNAVRFPYLTLSGTNVVDQRLPAWVRAAYPHTVSPDPALPAAFVRVDAGTMSVEIWRNAPLNRTNEVIFVTLSDGGHQWPNSGDQLPFNANVEVLKFFKAH